MIKAIFFSTPIKTKSAAKDYSDLNKTITTKRVRKKKNEVNNSIPLSNGIV